MKQFFIIVFGGLLVIGVSIAMLYGSGLLWQVISEKVDHLTKGGDTMVTGLKRIVRYTANEEEDMLSIASMSQSDSLTGPVTAPAYLVKNLTTKSSLISKNSDQLRPIASVAKLLTAVTARKLILPNVRISISKDIISTYGNTAGFRMGETFTAEDLSYPLLMVSSNDAAEALAQSYGRKKFIREMNDFAQSIGAYRTYIADPSGLSAYNVSTVNDLALILDWIRKNDPEILNITRMKTMTVRNHTWINPTHFLSWSNYLGGKNGYTPEADRTGASLFNMSHNKDVYAVIVLGSEFRDADELKLLKQVSK